MEISDLRIFQTVVKEGGIIKASEVLNRVPSNVTARIKKLEKELNQNLFIREKNRLRISSSGEAFLEYANKILVLTNEALGIFNQEEPIGRLRVGSMEAVAAARLTPVLASYCKQYENAEIDLKTGPTGELIEYILEGRIDIALVADKIENETIAANPIFIEKMVLVSNKNHKTIKSPSDLNTNPTLLVFNQRCAYRSQLINWLNCYTTIFKVIEINSYHTLLSCAAAGMGIGLVPVSIIESYPFKNELKLHSLKDEIAYSTTSAIWRKDNFTINVRLFLDLLNGISHFNSED